MFTNYNNYIVEGTSYFAFSKFGTRAWGWFTLSVAARDALSSGELYRLDIDKDKKPTFTLIYRAASIK